MTAPARYVTLEKFEEVTGISPDSVHKKRATGKWVEGQQWVKVDGRILIDMEGYYQWVETEAVSGKPAPRRSKSRSRTAVSGSGPGSGSSPPPLT